MHSVVTESYSDVNVRHIAAIVALKSIETWDYRPPPFRTSPRLVNKISAPSVEFAWNFQGNTLQPRRSMHPKPAVFSPRLTVDCTEKANLQDPKRQPRGSAWRKHLAESQPVVGLASIIHHHPPLSDTISRLRGYQTSSLTSPSTTKCGAWCPAWARWTPSGPSFKTFTDPTILVVDIPYITDGMWWGGHIKNVSLALTTLSNKLRLRPLGHFWWWKLPKTWAKLFELFRIQVSFVHMTSNAG